MQFKNSLKLERLLKISDIFHNAIKKERKNREALKRSTVNYEKNIKNISEKIGLTYDLNQNKICVSDESKRTKISMIHRVTYKILFTTNSLESYHGHLNKLIPRKNNFC